jgi:peptide methionine sulfoxide reductase msrA/msrB
MGAKGRFYGAGGAALVALAGASLLAAWSSSGRAGSTRTGASDKLVIDDFRPEGGRDSPGLAWELVIGPAAGGAARGKLQIEERGQRTCLHISGTLPARNKSGFLQGRRSLSARRRPLDARAYDGILLAVRGNGATYAVRLRTRDCRYPGQYYEAQFPTSGAWEDIKLPFGYFVSVGPVPPLDLAGLASVALVASRKTLDEEQQADIYLDEMAFYRERNMDRKLTLQEERVIVQKGTEPPFSGKYNEHFEKGVYTCRRCGAELFESQSKFRSDCGWPSFDEQIPGAVQWQPDADGQRTEAVCANCGAHLGHVFQGEGYTPKNTRYCVNSISMDFIPAEHRARKTQGANPGVEGVSPPTRGQDAHDTAPGANPQSAIPNPQSPERALFASGCFWGTEYYLQRAPGVISTTVGYTGGHVDHPTYEQVCTGRTGHAETVEVVYDPAKTSYEQLARLFFETHDFTQLNRQGPDVGPQYRSAIFYLNDEQRQVAERLVQQLRQRGYDVRTEITEAGKFWPAERYHQDYYNRTGGTPYCHLYRPIFQPRYSEAAK